MTANPGERDARASSAEPQYAGRVPADTFSNRLVLARRLAGMTIEEAADATGLSKSSWANWENGTRPHDRDEVCQAIAVALDVDLIWLTFGGPLTPARGRPTKRSAVDNCGYHSATSGPGPKSTRPTAGRPKVRGDRVRPIPAARPVKRPNYTDPTLQARDSHAA
jgi:DNA-binding XRE family transcriptional regulator